MMLFKRLSIVLVAALAAGCSGGSGSTSLPKTTTPGDGTTSSHRVTVAIHVPAKTGAAASTSARKPYFVSPDTNFVTVTTYLGPPASSASQGSVTSDVSNPNGDAASTCKFDNGSGPVASGGNGTTGNGSRTCKIEVDAPAGSDYFTFKTYQTGPVGSPTNLLGEATTPATTITANTNNTVSVTLGGVISSFVFVQATGSSFDQAFDHTSYFNVSAYDAAGDLIVAGTADPYENPISIGAIPGTNYPSSLTSLAIINATTNANEASGMVVSSSDVVEVGYKSAQEYSGATPPFSEQLTGTAKDPSGALPAVFVTTTQIDPIALTETGSTAAPGSANPNSVPTFMQGYGNMASTLAFTANGQTATITPEEVTPSIPGAPAPVYTAALSGTCTNTTIQPGTANQGFSLSATTRKIDATSVTTPTTSFTITSTGPTGGSCVATFTDNYNGTAVLDLSTTAQTAGGGGGTVN